MTAEDRIDEALKLITEFGGVDGSHHKQWVLDQVVRRLTDCPVNTLTLIQNGRERSYTTLGESEEYTSWVEEYRNGEDGPDTYSWDWGIAP